MNKQGPLQPNSPLRRQQSPSISIVVPMHNEEAVIDSFFSRVLPVIEAETESFEIICVDDGSNDATVSKLFDVRARLPQVEIISLSRNFGKEAALTAGIDASTGDVVIPIDADLQDPPEVIPEMLKHWRHGADVVVGVRVDRTSDTAFKRWSAGSFYRVFNKLSDVPIPENAGDFRLMDRRVVNVLNHLPEKSRFMKGIFSWVGFTTEYVEFQREARVAGTTSWKYWNLWNFALEGIVSFTTIPLRIWTYLGFLTAFASLIYMFWVIFKVLLLGVDVPGYASLTVLVLFSLSLNMVGIGILGEYVGRVFNEVKARPLYVVNFNTAAGPLRDDLRLGQNGSTKSDGPGDIEDTLVGTPDTIESD